MLFSIDFFVLISVIVSLFSFLFAEWLFRWVKKRPSQNASIANVGLLIRDGAFTFYVTDDSRKPIRNAAKASETGPALTILIGVSYGFISSLPVRVGISMAAVVMLSIVGMIISNYAYGLIVDNARGMIVQADY